MNPDELFKEGKPFTSRNATIVCKDKKSSSRYIALNKKRKNTCKIHIDGDLMRGNVQRCDYGLWVEEGNKMFLIELKGSDVEKACAQVMSTYDFLNKKCAKEHFTYLVRIVVSKYPAPNLQFGPKIIQRQLGLDVRIKERILKENI